MESCTSSAVPENDNLTSEAAPMSIRPHLAVIHGRPMKAESGSGGQRQVKRAEALSENISRHK